MIRKRTMETKNFRETRNRKMSEDERVLPKTHHWWSFVQTCLIKFDTNRKGRSIEESLTSIGKKCWRTRIKKITDQSLLLPFLEVAEKRIEFDRRVKMKSIGHQHFIIVEDEQNEKLKNSLIIPIDLNWFGKIQMKNNRKTIRMKLTFLSIILRRTKTTNRWMIVRRHNTQTSITPIRRQRQWQRPDRRWNWRNHRWRLWVCDVHVGWISRQTQNRRYASSKESFPFAIREKKSI